MYQKRQVFLLIAIALTAIVLLPSITLGSSGALPGILPISICSNITTSGTTTLTTDITGVQSGRNVCIDIQANNVILDCGGHSISYNEWPNSIGIFANNRNGLTIKNCIVTDYNQAISLNNVANSIIANNIANNNSGYGIFVVSSSYNNIINNTANNNSISIYFEYSTHNSIINNTANLNFIGISIEVSSNYNNFINNTASNNDAGIYLNIVSFNTLLNNIINNNRDGIDLVGESSSNIITNNTAENNIIWDFYSESNSLYNTVTNLNIGSTVISFTSKDISLKSAATHPADPSGLLNINKYVNATNNAIDSWLFLNVSYSHSDLGNVNESTLAMAKYSGGIWRTNPATFANTYGVNTAANYVYANITKFGSIFAPLGVHTLAPSTKEENNGGEITPVQPTNLGILTETPKAVTLNLEDSATFTSKSELHTVKVSGISGNAVLIEISSSIPIMATFGIGDTKQFDTNGNGIDDLEVTLVSKTDTSANLQIKALSETSTAPTEVAVTQSSEGTAANPDSIMTNVVIVLLIMAALIYIARSRVLRH